MWRTVPVLVLVGLSGMIGTAQEVDSFAAAFDSAVAAYEAGDFWAAEAGLARCAGERPEDPVILTWLGCVRLRLSRWEDARSVLLRALEKDPDCAPALADLAEAQAALGQWAEAAESYRAALRLRVDWPEVRARATAALQHLGRHDEACALWREASEQSPGDLYALAHLGLAYEAAGQMDRALETYRQALEQAPTDPQALVLLARASLKAEAPQMVLSALQELEGTEIPLGQKAELRGRALLALNRAAEAADSLKTAIDSGRATYENYGLLALAEAGLGDFESSRRDYGRALASVDNQGNPPPESIRAALLTNLGCSLVRLGRYSEAVMVLTDALAADPNSPAAHSNLADAYLGLQDAGRAGEQLEALLAARPGDAAVLARILDLILAGSAYHPSDSALLALAKDPPDDFERLHRLGVLLIQRGHPAEAAEVFQGAVSKNRYSIDARNNLGAALELVGQWEAALKEYETAYHLDPSGEAARQNRERVLGRLGRAGE